MTESHEAFATTLQALSHHELAVETFSPRPVEARPGTLTWWTKVTGFVVSAIGQTLSPSMETRPRRHYPSRSSYLERSWIQREMSRP